MSLLTTWTPLRSLTENTPMLGGLVSPTYTSAHAATTLTRFLTDCPEHLVVPMSDRVAIIMGTNAECRAVTGWNPEPFGDWSGMTQHGPDATGRVWIDTGNQVGSTLLHEWGHVVDFLGTPARRSTATPWTGWWAATSTVRATYDTAYNYYGWTNDAEFFAELFTYHWLARSARLTAAERSTNDGIFARLLQGPFQNTNLTLPAQVHAWFDALVLDPPTLN